LSNLLTRALTGVVFVIVLTGAVWYNSASAAVLFLFIGIAGYPEYQKLTKTPPDKLSFGIYALVTSLCWILLYTEHFQWLPLLLASFFVLELIKFIFTDRLNLQDLGKSIFGFIYLNLAFFALYLIGFSHGSSYNPIPVLMVFFMVWANDTGAYLVGRALGKHKMIEKLSPKKTWEGTIGGLIIAGVIGFILARYAFDLNETQYAIAGVITGVGATLGDLFESKLKRLSGVKDSGALLPGHGGILDRFDALYLAAPLNYILLFWPF
jgi:phosphatidate cytidylyltransferase